MGAFMDIGKGFLQARSTAYQTAAQTQEMQARADAAAYNEAVARQNVDITRGQTEAQLEKAGRARRLRAGATIARGGAGMGLTGSILDVMQDNAAQEELNMLTIESEGALKERDFTSQATLLKAQQTNIAGQIPLVKKAGRTSQAASILGGVSTAFSNAMGAFA